MYSKYQKRQALALYDQLQTVTGVIQRLGYPTRQAMHVWIRTRDIPPKKKRSRARWNNTPEHLLHPPVDLKRQILHRCFELGENVRLVSEETGYSAASIYTWRRTYTQKGLTGLMNNHDDPRGKLPEGELQSSLDVQQLKEQMQDMQLEIDILKETLDLLKKDLGTDVTPLKNREKAVIIDALKEKHTLPILLHRLNISRSSYYYQHTVMQTYKASDELSSRIKSLFIENSERYGYRRIHALLIREGRRISEKIVRSTMTANGLRVKGKRKNKVYSSYKGEISPSVPNIIERDFHADLPNEKWLTDITEFAIPSGKLYFSPILDCFDGMIVSWNLSTVPDAKLVNLMIDEAIMTLKEQEHPLVHTDRGSHYRWPGWITRMENAGLPRSMSKKGCSPDNSACEGLFGRIKNEMFYNRNWSGVTISQFIDIMNNYVIWYNEKRIKISLGNMSPLEYRRSLGIAA